MAISEAARSDLYNGLRDVLGPERAETLMSAIPLHDLDEVATKRDIAELRAEIAELRAELKEDIAALRVEMANEIGALRKTMSNWMVTVLVAVVGAMVSIALIT